MSITKPLITAAANKPTMIEAALVYAELSMSVIPLVGKRCSVNWSERQVKRAPYSMIHGWHARGVLANVGIVTGQVSGNLVVIDLDGDEAVAAFSSKFPDLLNTFTVASGSGHGRHMYYYPDIMPDTTRATGTRIGNVELRANGCYVAAPPSIHPQSGKPYTVAVAMPIMRVNNLEKVVYWIKSLIAEKHGGKLPNGKPSLSPKSVKAWAKAALAAECTAVRLAPEGTRNNTLNRAAFKLGQIVAVGDLDVETTVNELYRAAAQLTATDGEAATLRTIYSGLNAGMANPRGKTS